MGNRIPSLPSQSSPPSGHSGELAEWVGPTIVEDSERGKDDHDALESFRREAKGRLGTKLLEDIQQSWTRYREGLSVRQHTFHFTFPIIRLRTECLF